MISIFLILGTALRLLMFVTQKSLWFDEWASIDVASQTLKNVIILNIADTHPPLYFILLHESMRFLGSNDWAIRLPSLLPGIAAIGAVYLCAREFFDKKTALLSAFFVAISPFFIHLSFEIRNHGLPIFLCSLGTFFLLKMVKEPFSRTWGYAYALIASASVYVDHFAWFWFVSALVFHICNLKSKPYSNKRSLIFQGIAWAFSSIALALFIYHFALDKGNLAYDDFSMMSYLSVIKQFLIVYWHFIISPEFFVYWNSAIISLLKTSPAFWFCCIIFLLAGILFIQALLKLWRDEKRVSLFFLMITVLPLLLVAFTDLTRLETRYFGFAAPFIWILLSRQIMSLKQPIARVGFIALFSVAALYGDGKIIASQTDPMHEENYIAMTKYIVSKASDHDAIQTSPLFDYYLKYLKLSTRAHVLDDVNQLTIQKAQKYDYFWYIDGMPVYSYDFPIIENRMKLLGFYTKGREITFGGERDYAIVNLFERVSKQPNRSRPAKPHS